MYSEIMKKIYLIIGATLLLAAAPLSEEEAQALFDSIKQSEYSSVIALWDNEMKIKTQTRSSGRKSVWDEEDEEEEPLDNKDHAGYYPTESHPVAIP